MHKSYAITHAIFLRIIIVGVKNQNIGGFLAIDDISFTNSLCSIYPPEVITELASLTTTSTSTSTPNLNNDFDCNFDNRDLCGWKNDNTADFDWMINRGSTSLFDTGPSSGMILTANKFIIHYKIIKLNKDVSGNGYYVYIKAVDKIQGQKGRLVSPLLNSTFTAQPSNFYQLKRLLFR